MTRNHRDQPLLRKASISDAVELLVRHSRAHSGICMAAIGICPFLLSFRRLVVFDSYCEVDASIVFNDPPPNNLPPNDLPPYDLPPNDPPPNDPSLNYPPPNYPPPNYPHSMIPHPLSLSANYASQHHQP